MMLDVVKLSEEAGLDPILVEVCARSAHEVNKAYCEALSDFSQKPWDDAPDWARISAVKGAIEVIRDPKRQPGQSHESWLKEKEETGWKYGPVKDPEKKEHPCFVPFDQLPVDQQAKDFLFIAAVRSAAEAFSRALDIAEVRKVDARVEGLLDISNERFEQIG